MTEKIFNSCFLDEAQLVERNRVLYEIAMSIGNTLDMKQMSREVLDTILKKISAKSAAIIQKEKDAEIDFNNIIYSIPRRMKSNSIYKEIIKTINRNEEFYEQKYSFNDTNFYIFELKEFGFFVIVIDRDIEPLILQSLRPIMEKITTSLQACTLYKDVQVNLDKV